MFTWLLENNGLRQALQSVASLKFTANSTINQELCVENLSKEPKTIDSLRVLIDGTVIHEQTELNISVGVAGLVTITLENCQLPADGQEFRLELLDLDGNVLAHITRKCTFVSEW